MIFHRKLPAGVALVYHIVSPSGRGYIGVTGHLRLRLWQHLNSETFLGSSLRKYGLDAHEIKILAVLPTEEAFALEERAVLAFGTLAPHGMNLYLGGLGGARALKGRVLPESEREKHRGWRHDEGTKMVIAERAREQWAPFAKPKKNGKPKSPEHRAKLAAHLATMRNDPARLAGLRAIHAMRRVA